MLKTGICRARDLSSRSSLFGRRRAISYLLLRPLQRNSAFTGLFEELVAEMRLASGIYRTTHRGRFDSIDKDAAEMIASRFGHDSVRVHDWAVSDAITSMEFARTLSGKNAKLHFTASDLYLHLVECEDGKGNSFVLQPDGGGVQFVRSPFVISLSENESPIYPLNKIMQRHARRMLPKLQRLVREAKWPAVPWDGYLQLDGWRVSQLSLVHPEVLQFRENNPWFQLTMHSIFEPLAEPVEMIRTMNIFHSHYFDNEEILRGARGIWKSIRVGGLWLVGRNVSDSPPVLDASVFERRSDGFRIVKQYGNGTELEGLIVSASREWQ